MTKVIPLSNNDKTPPKEKKKLSIVITSHGMFFSGSAPYAHDIYTKFTHETFSVTKATELIEKEHNVKIKFKLAIQEMIEKNSIRNLNPDQIIIRDKNEKEDFLFTIEDTQPDIIHDIWMDILTEDETDFYEEIGYLMQSHADTMLKFIENCLCTLEHERVNGEFDKSYTEEVYKSFDKVNVFEIEKYKTYLNHGNPKKTYEYMGLQL